MSLGRGAAPTLVNKQFNSPIRLYSPESVQEALNKHTQALSNGAIGIDFHQLAAPNLANSAVLKMLEEEERQRGGKDISGTNTRGSLHQFEWPPKDVGHRIHGISNDIKYRHCSFSTFYFSTLPGLKRVAWPPPSENSENIVAEQAVYKKGPVSQQQNTWENSFDQVPASQLQQQQEQNQFYPPPQQQVYQPQYETPPTTVVLRAAAPVSQEPPPVFTSQPAATKGVGQNMRGDQKWPPSAYKLQAEAENEARKALAKGPAFRPKKVKKDYSAFFAQNALTPNYPTYKAPPGTQHYIEEGTSTF
ncbi:uncharacterized protein LOC110838033 isoform X2 [Zootermopsis nevadensis]|uniref:uncharacterized protein LOC110838033 isoform X2 n=1 Tax=Zootermopsis nevadensis TaxID=136037 RepID=UPI000B8E9FF6|nr:uncharacterized protein LOC110838033 isoform X2 [Zootermopsis nevadensis]